MATLSAALTAIERHLHFPETRVRQLARRLSESGILPTGSPGRSLDIEPRDFVALVIASATDSGLGNTVASVEAIGRLVPGGTDLASGPLNIPHDARRALNEVAHQALAHRAGHDALRAQAWEFESTPAVAIHGPRGTRRFMRLGTNPDEPAAGHRTSTTVFGPALAAALLQTFGK